MPNIRTYFAGVLFQTGLEGGHDIGFVGGINGAAGLPHPAAVATHISMLQCQPCSPGSGNSAPAARCRRAEYRGRQRRWGKGR